VTMSERSETSFTDGQGQCMPGNWKTCSRTTLKDIVMFDVPPPDDGVRGLDAYSHVWPPFFEFQQLGASFEIVSLEVTAGDDVAFAWALLRCGTDDELRKDPDNRLRLTIGLRRDGERWIVTHEHHSFPLKS
jgi:ketosteroid isomerase-like protein